MHAPFGLEYPLAAVTVLDAGGMDLHVWGIENRLHYVRDVGFAEDRCRVRAGARPLASLRNLAIGLSISEARENFREDRANAITLVTGRVPWRGPHATSRNRPRQLTRFPSGGTRREAEPVRGCSFRNRRCQLPFALSTSAEKNGFDASPDAASRGAVKASRDSDVTMLNASDVYVRLTSAEEPLPTPDGCAVRLQQNSTSLSTRVLAQRRPAKQE